jgi:photosystem II stability/assembly factor-like uncharacterized protein
MYSQWVLQKSGLPFNWNVATAIDASDNNTCIIGGYDPYVLKTEDSGNTWEKIKYPAFSKLLGNDSLYEGIIDLSIINSQFFWICTDAGRILSTTDGGTTWAAQFYDTTKTKFMAYIKMFDLNDGLAVGDAIDSTGPAIFLKTTDRGDNWVSENSSQLLGIFSGDVWRRIDFVDINTGYFRESGNLPQRLLKTTNGGKNWTNTNFQYGDLIKFYNKNLGLAVYLDSPQPNLLFKISRTTDGGNSWETFKLNSKGWPNDVEFLPGDPSKVWYVDLDNLYYSSDTGRTWKEQKIYDGALWGRDLIFTDNEHGWLLCDSGKLFYTSNNGGIISNIAENKNEVTSGCSLEQNYPNPFNPSTTIKYSIPKYSFVSLIVYDLLGRKVQSLVNGLKSAGAYKVVFNGEKLSAGVYIYTLNSGEFIFRRKLILLK